MRQCVEQKVRLDLRAHHHQPRLGELPGVGLGAFARLRDHRALLAARGASCQATCDQHQQKERQQCSKRNAAVNQFLRVALHRSVNQFARRRIDIHRHGDRSSIKVDGGLRPLAEHAEGDGFFTDRFVGIPAVRLRREFVSAALHLLQLRDAFLQRLHFGGELFDGRGRVRRIEFAAQFAADLLQRTTALFDLFTL